MRTAFAPTARDDSPPAKPKGGYRIITAALLAAAWWAYRQKWIRLVDLRVWFAAHEIDARRCRVELDFTPRFNLRELRGLTGLSVKRLKDSLRRLQAARLLSWSETALAFPDSTDLLFEGDQDDFRAFLDRIPNPERKVPVPRRILRLLAGGARPALIATVLGHLIRGLYLKSGKCLARGRVKASWIAEVFGVSLRRVKHARQELIASGWLIPLPTDQWALNRWGAHFRINLEWSRLDARGPIASVLEPNRRETTTGGAPAHSIRGEAIPDPGQESAPPPVLSGPKLAPPDSYREPLTGSDENQKPASGGPAGISTFKPKEGRTKPRDFSNPNVAVAANLSAPLSIATATISAARVPIRTEWSPPALTGTKPNAASKPDFRNVVPEDLKDTGRLLELHDQAVAQGLVTTSERDRLRFVAAAEHARVIGTKNPCGLFVRLVRCGLWSFLTQDDEDAANFRLKNHLYGKPSERQSPSTPNVLEVRVLSEDARLVQAIRAVMARMKCRGDGFPLLKRERPEWTRERWNQALEELSR